MKSARDASNAKFEEYVATQPKFTALQKSNAKYKQDLEEQRQVEDAKLTARQKVDERFQAHVDSQPKHKSALQRSNRNYENFVASTGKTMAQLAALPAAPKTLAAPAAAPVKTDVVAPAAAKAGRSWTWGEMLTLGLYTAPSQDAAPAAAPAPSITPTGPR